MSAYEYGPFADFPMDEMGRVGSAVLAVYFAVILLANIYSIVVYVLQSIGLYSIANRRGIHHPWLAWIPVGFLWIMGSISDQYQYVAKGQIKSRRKTLLGLAIASVVLALVFIGIVVWVVISAVGVEMGVGYFDETALIAPVIIAVVAYLALLVIAIVSAVFQYICLYNLYASCNPNNAVAFLVLGIFFSFLTPFFIFACRKKDLGMPPRRTQIPAAPWQPAQPAQNQWQQPVQPTQPVQQWQQPAQPQVPENEDSTESLNEE